MLIFLIGMPGSGKTSIGKELSKLMGSNLIDLDEYIAKKEKGKLDLIIMSCGSELQHALAAAKELGDGVRVVSMPCLERFARESEEYRKEVLPNSCRRRVAIEAGVPEIWYQYVGLDGKVVGLHEFGLSAPGAEVMKERGIDVKHVIEAARSLGSG